MKKQDAVAHFGGVKPLADALGIYPQSIYRWDEVPYEQACVLEALTGGALKAPTAAEKLAADKARRTAKIAQKRLQEAPGDSGCRDLKDYPRSAMPGALPR